MIREKLSCFWAPERAIPLVDKEARCSGDARFTTVHEVLFDIRFVLAAGGWPHISFRLRRYGCPIPDDFGAGLIRHLEGQGVRRG